MRSLRPDPDAEATARRFAQLEEELALHRGVAPARPVAPAVDLTSADWWDDHTRPAAPRSAPPPLPPPAPTPPPVVAAPGRHLAARSRLALGPPQLAVVAVVALLGLALTCWWLVRGGAEPAGDLEAAPALVSSAPTPTSAPVTPAATATGSPPGTVTVDVAGKVRRPGIAVLDAGARVVDALAAAGGARPGVDTSALNLARPLVDGEQVLVGVPPPDGVAASAAGSAPPPSPTAPGAPALVNLNTATEAELDTLPDVGPVTAASILAWRTEHGGFTSVDELLEVDGIGEVTLTRLAPYVTV